MARDSELIEAGRDAAEVTEARYRCLLETMSSGLGITDAEENLLFCNRSFCEILGIEEADFQRYNMKDFVHPDDLARLMAETRRRTAGHQGRYELRILRPDGTEREIHLSVSPLRSDDGVIREAVGVIEDVTNAKRLEREIESLARFPEQNPSPVLRVARSGRVLYANAAGAALTPLFAAADASAVRQVWSVRLAEILDRGEPAELELECPPRRYLVSVVPVAEEDYVNLYALDISERHLAMERLARAREQALQSSRAKSEFLARISHELRTPLNGVMGMTTLLEETELSAEQKEYLSDLRQSADRLTRLVFQMLDFSQLESGTLELQPVEFDPRALLESAVAFFSPEARALGLDLVSELTPKLPSRVHGDPRRLRQILDHLLSNALRFTESGGIELACDVREADENGVTIEIRVSDTGPGIPPDEQQAIFRPFAQIDGSATRSHEGAGLGLAIAEQLARKMGGEITASPRKGGGSIFSVLVRLSLPDPG